MFTSKVKMDKQAAFLKSTGLSNSGKYIIEVLQINRENLDNLTNLR